MISFEHVTIFYVIGHDVNQLCGIHALIKLSLDRTKCLKWCCARALLRRLADVFTTLVKVQNDVTYIPLYSVLLFRFFQSLFCDFTIIGTWRYFILVHFDGACINLYDSFLFAIVYQSNPRLNCFVDVLFLDNVGLNSLCT